MSSRDLITLGSIGRPHGIKGSFFVEGRREKLPDYDIIFIGPDKIPSKITESMMSGGRNVLRLEAIPDRTQAEKMRGQELFVHAEDVEVDDETEFLWSDIVGRSVQYQGNVVGEIFRIYETPACVNICVSHEDKEVDMPLNEQFFDMSFKRGTKILNMVVPPDFFSDLWVKRKK